MAAEARELRAALRSKTGKASVPLWATIIVWAERFGIPPWQMEEDMTGYWYHRLAAYDKEVGDYRRQEEARARAKRGKR